PYFFTLPFSQTFVLFRLEVPCHPLSQLTGCINFCTTAIASSYQRNALTTSDEYIRLFAKVLLSKFSDGFSGPSHKRKNFLWDGHLARPSYFCKRSIAKD
ncbi:hypothetical protein QUA40_18485, partial [Microcoleus sp. Pol11C3]|uniref:hypothetical protein n=1 Tax=Microcoleus sp. Pol11C3 TaxID=3055390 RepID=UPI002FD15597